MRPLALILFAFLIVGCNTGLHPPAPEPGIGGEIRFITSSWPSPDSLRGLWLFASKEYPLDSARVIAGVLVEPRFIFLYPSFTTSLPLYVDKVSFKFSLEPGTYPYVGVIQQLRTELLISSFRVVGVLSVIGHDTIPRSVVVDEGNFTDGLTLVVDFQNPPPQPFQ